MKIFLGIRPVRRIFCGIRTVNHFFPVGFQRKIFLLFSPRSRMKEENSSGNQIRHVPLLIAESATLLCHQRFSSCVRFGLHYAFYRCHSPISRLVPSLSELNWPNFIALNGRLAAAGQSKFFEADPFFYLK